MDYRRLPLACGKPAIRSTRLSVIPILECLSAGVKVDVINEGFGGGLPPEGLTEVLEVAADRADEPCVAP